MNDWVHCNKCSMKYNPNIKLFLTECGHLFCQRCTENLKDSKCSLCDKSVKIIPISNDMDASVQQFFIPFETQLKKTIEVYNFQMQHRARLLQTTLQKYKFAKNECITAFNKYREAAKENKVLKSMLMVGGKNSNPHPFTTSTPLVNASQTDGMSMSSIGFTPSVRDGMPAGFSSGPGIAQRMQSRNVNIRGPYLPPRLNSGGSSLARSSTAQLVPNMERKLNIAPVHRSSGSAFSMEQLRRAGKRT